MKRRPTLVTYECPGCGVVSASRWCGQCGVEAEVGLIDDKAKDFLGKFYPALCIQVFDYKHVPKQIVDLCPDDSDWFAVLPPVYAMNEYVSWMEEGGPFGCCAVERFRTLDGWEIRIGCHS